MPSFGDAPVLQLFRSLGAELDGVLAKLDAVDASARQAAESARAAAEENRGSFLALVEESARMRDQVRGLSADAAQTAEANADRVAAAGARSVASTRQVAEDVRSATDGMETEVGQATERVATRLDDLLVLARGKRNQWDEELVLQIEALNLGLQSMEEFLAKWGEGIVRFDGQAKTVRELLAGIDYRGPINEIEKLIKAYRDGQIELDRVIAFLRERAPEVAARFLEVLDAFRAGKVTIERFAEIVENLRRQFANTPFSELADEILKQLQNAQRDGTL